MEEEQRARIQAQTTVLTSIIEQMRTSSTDKFKAQAEAERLSRLYQSLSTENSGSEEVMTWRQVFFGRKKPKEGEAESMNQWEQADWNERKLMDPLVKM